jgi:hypothetical protein
MIMMLAPALRDLPALTRLSLPQRHALPAEVSLLTALSALAVLELGTQSVAHMAGSLSPGGVAEQGVVPLLRQMRGLRQVIHLPAD